MKSLSLMPATAGVCAALTGCVAGDLRVVGEDNEGGQYTGQAITAIAAGQFAPLASYAQTNISGGAQLVRLADGTTRVDVQLTGVAPNTDYPAHVHAQPCAFAGGGHYKVDPVIEDTVEANELWPYFASDAEGVGAASVSFAHDARGDALSIIVHDPAMDNAKMACADLLVDDTGPVEATGTIAVFAGAEPIDQNIAGTATMMRDGASTRVQLNVTGLDPASEYVSHIHALPCEVNKGGGHYKIDPTVEDTVEANELWPTLAVQADGSSTPAMLNSDHVARADAQSVVLHRKVGEDAPKVACANLTRTSFPNLTAAGTAALLPDGQAQVPNLQATATSTRKLDGSTEFTLQVSGGTPNQSHSVHVHDAPCSVSNGGGHYKIDTGIAEALEDNEIWLDFTADGAGAGQASKAVGHLARVEAQSIVIHGAEGARLACIDLD
jgi:hypothetical protein